VVVRAFFIIEELKVARKSDKSANIVCGDCDSVKSVMTCAMNGN
jgi:hypothetical protein